MFQRSFSLRSKIILLVSATAFCTALIIGGLNYYSISQVAIDKAMEELAGESRLAAVNVKDAFADMKDDAHAVRAHHRNSRHHLQQPQWRRRPELRHSPHILARAAGTGLRGDDEGAAVLPQIRYIGLADNGREMVRVDRRRDGKIETVAAEILQEKGGEVYFQEGINLQQRHRILFARYL